MRAILDHSARREPISERSRLLSGRRGGDRAGVLLEHAIDRRTDGRAGPLGTLYERCFI
jgi:hypothetical protein